MVTGGINGSWCGGEGGGWRAAWGLVGGERQEKGEEGMTGWDRTEGAGRRGRRQRRGQGRDREAEERGGDEGEERAGVKARGTSSISREAPSGLSHVLSHRFSWQPCLVGITAPILRMRKLRFPITSNWLRVTQQVREEMAFEQEEGQRDRVRGREAQGPGKAWGKWEEAETSREATGCRPGAGPSTHNAVWGWRAPDETLHLATITPDGVLHGLAGDNGGPCK